MKILAERGIVKDSKEKLAYVAEDFEAPITKAKHHWMLKQIMNWQMNK